MADIGDIQSTFDNDFFRSACQDVLRIVSVLSLDSTDVTKPRSQVSGLQSMREKITYLSRFFYMVFIKGFTPTVFDVLPYWFWRLLTTMIFLYRLFLLPFWLRLTGYTRYADWSDIGSKQPAKDAPEAQPLKTVNLSSETNLSALDFADPHYEKFITQLYKFTTHLSPHSQCPPNPFTHNGFPGNFFDHLTGVYKILVVQERRNDATDAIERDSSDLMKKSFENCAFNGACSSIQFGESSISLACDTERDQHPEMPFLKKWVRTKQAVLFRISNRTVQIVFFDGSQVLLSSHGSVITFVNKTGERTEHTLQEVLKSGTLFTIKSYHGDAFSSHRNLRWAY